MTTKIEALVEEIPRTTEYGNVFVREDVGGSDRLRVGLNEAQDTCVRTLASTLSGPFQLLYVLHTTRTGAELGRYESPELTRAGVEEFFNEFGRYISEDSRHDLWVRSHDDDATIVLDRHNVIYAYGPLDAFEAALQSLGARRGEPAVLGAHVHHYHAAWMKRSARSCGLLSGTSSRYVRPTFNSTRRVTIDNRLRVPSSSDSATLALPLRRDAR